MAKRFLGALGLGLTLALTGCVDQALTSEIKPPRVDRWQVSKVAAPAPQPFEAAPKTGLPDGGIARITRSSLKAAWYEGPTTRYAHAILGDAVEAGVLVAQTAKGKTLRLTLPVNQVFEDRTPRLVDLDGDGTTEIVTLLAQQGSGAAVAVYGERDGALILLSQTPFIGRANRWRNVAGIADFDGDGFLRIAEVVTPHIGGTLRFWTWKRGQLVPSGQALGFSNHAIGSRLQGLSVVEDFDGDGVEDLAVPDARRTIVRIMGFTGKANGKKTLREIASVPLPSEISQNMRAVTVNGQPGVLVGLRGGQWLRLLPPKPVQQ
ncbi:MAG: VCBS repeat-containing protein [Pseudomonadota bacterium]